MKNIVLIKQFKNKKKEPVAGLTPEHAIYDANGVRLDAKLGNVNLQEFRDLQQQCVNNINAKVVEAETEIDAKYEEVSQLTQASMINSNTEGLEGSNVQDNLNDAGGRLSELESQVIYDVTANNNGVTFSSLSELFSDKNLSTLIPSIARCGGMSIRFVQSSDNKYVQYRLMNQNWSITVTDWQGVDEVPTAGSNNLVKSSGIYSKEQINLGELYPLYKGMSDISMEIIEDVVNLSLVVGGYNMSGVYIQVTNRARYNDFLISTEFSLLSAASGYKIYLFGNNEGYGNTLTYITEGSLINITNAIASNYKYLALVVGKSDNSDFTDGDDLTSILSVSKKIGFVLPDITRLKTFRLFNRQLNAYTSKLVALSNAIKQCYVSGEKISNLKVLLMRKQGVSSATDSHLIIGTGTNSQDVVFMADITESSAVGTKQYTTTYSNRTFYITIDWDLVNFNYSNLYGAEYELSDNIYIDFYAPNKRIDDISQVLQAIQNVLPQEQVWMDINPPLEVGAYTANGTKNPFNTTHFINSIPFDAAKTKSISSATGYSFTVWGNNDGLGHDITYISDFVTSYVIDGTYKYIFIVGKRSNGETIIQSELENVITTNSLVDNGVFKECSAKEDVKGQNLIVVDINGSGDYTSLQDAITNAGDTAQTPKTIIVLPGVYQMPAYDADTRYLCSNRYLSIIGTDKNNCVIRNDVGYYRTSGGYIDNAPLKLAGNIYVANLTIISTDTNYPESAEADRHMAYCIHLDFNAPENSVCEINNCVLINNHFSCIGFGLRKNYTIKIINCELTTTMAESNGLYDYATLYGHDGNDGSVLEIQEHLFVKDCVITNTNGAYGIRYMDAFEKLADFTLVGNVIDTPIGTGFAKTDTVSLTRKCFGNNLSSMNYQ